MSADAPAGESGGLVRDLRPDDLAVSYHRLAVGATAVLMATYLSVLYHVTDVVGGTTALLAAVAATLVVATAVARRLRPVQAAALGVGLLAVGLVGYYLTVPSAYLVGVSVGNVLADNVALLTGLSVLRMTEVGAWALGVAPAMAFAPWYFVLRRRYVPAVATAGVALGFFVLTGDAGSFVTLAGSLAAAATLGFGTLARRGGTAAQVDTLAVVLVAMVLVPSVFSLVPGGAASPILPGGPGGASTVEDAFVTGGDRMSIVGSIRLSPKVRFTVEANRSAYWRVAAYDRYDGDGWIRTGDPVDYRDQPAPPGPARTLTQTVTVETDRMSSMPAAWRPVRLASGDRENTQVSPGGAFDPVGPLRQGEQYTVVSRVPSPSERRLRTAGTDYPARVENRYLQLPGSSADRIRERTDRIVADAGAETPYAKAKGIERWLEANKGYSLNVSRPDGGIAESFIFDMRRGYCTYYATAMVAMLRSQGVPARFAVGYAPGQRVAADEWVVRGLDSHAWVEVYFPDVGWVPFDPTPAGPRRRVEHSRLEHARENGVDNVDAAGSDEGAWTTTATTTTDPVSNANGTNSPDVTASVGTTASSDGAADRRPIAPGDPVDGVNGTYTTVGNGTGGSGGAGGLPVGLPSRERAVLGAIVAVGLLAVGRRTGVLGRFRRAVWLRWQPRRDPETDVERAFDRLEYLLAGRYRERDPGETPREYLAALDAARGLDDRAERVGAIYERVRYAGEADDSLAAEAVSLVDELVRERRGRLPGR